MTGDWTASGPDGCAAMATVKKWEAVCRAAVLIGLMVVGAILVLAKQRVNADVALARIAAGCKE